MFKMTNIFKKPPASEVMEGLAEWSRNHLPEQQRRDLADWFAREYPKFDMRQFLIRAGVQ
jgi:hypothetical protein